MIGRQPSRQEIDSSRPLELHQNKNRNNKDKSNKIDYYSLLANKKAKNASKKRLALQNKVLRSQKDSQKIGFKDMSYSHKSGANLIENSTRLGILTFLILDSSKSEITALERLSYMNA